jgi:D-Tyr-tRNAtyr deacylase
MQSGLARFLYEKFIDEMMKEGIVVKTGVFGALMQINLIN